jgi:hypothetical protein
MILITMATIGLRTKNSPIILAFLNYLEGADLSPGIPGCQSVGFGVMTVPFLNNWVPPKAILSPAARPSSTM